MNIEKNKNASDIAGNIDLGFSVKKKRFSVGGDTNTVIEFDPTDINMSTRLSDSLEKFKHLESEWEELHNQAKSLDGTNEDVTVEQSIDFSKKLDKIEKSIRQLIDYIFDSSVADTLLKNSSAFSPVNGYFKYEHIITALVNCFEEHIKMETPKFNARNIQKYTGKYLKK